MIHYICNVIKNKYYVTRNKKILMVILIGLWTGGFLMGIGIGAYIGKIGERKDWDKLIREGRLPKPDQRWKPEDWK